MRMRPFGVMQRLEICRCQVGERGGRLHRLVQPDPGIDQAVEQIDHDHHEHEKGAVEHRGAHDHGVVELLHGLHEIAAETGDGEHQFHHEAAGGDRGDRRAEHGDHGQTRRCAADGG